MVPELEGFLKGMDRAGQAALARYPREADPQYAFILNRTEMNNFLMQSFYILNLISNYEISLNHSFIKSP